MNFRTFILTALFLTGSVSAGAKVIPPRPFSLDREITVSGARVPQGMYTLKLESQGASVRVTFWREGQFIATTHGTWVRHGVKYTEDAVLLRVNDDGTRALTEIRLAGSPKTIVIEGESPVLRISPAPKSGSGNSPTGALN